MPRRRRGRGGTTVAPDRIWASDRDNGATLLTVSAGHSLDTLRYALGEITDLSARVVTLDPRATVIGTSETITVTSPDNVLVQGRLASGAVLSAQFLSAPGGSGSSWTIYGEDGVLEIRVERLPVALRHEACEPRVLEFSARAAALAKSDGGAMKEVLQQGRHGPRRSLS